MAEIRQMIIHEEDTLTVIGSDYGYCKYGDVLCWFAAMPYLWDDPDAIGSFVRWTDPAMRRMQDKNVRQARQVSNELDPSKVFVKTDFIN